eukprot:463792_1
MSISEMIILEVIFASAAVTVTSSFFIKFLFNEYHFKQYGFKIWKLNFENICCIASLAFFVISSLWFTTNSIYIITSTVHNSFDKHFCISRWFDPSAWSMAKLMVYLFFISRLHSIFGGTIFAIPTNRLKLMAFIVCIPNIIYITMMYYVLAIPTRLILNTNVSINNVEDCSNFFGANVSAGVKQYMYIGIVVSLLNQIIFSIIILRLFLKRIIFLSLSLKGMTKRALIDKPLLQLAIKTTNLTILAFSTMFIFLLNRTVISGAIVYNIDGVITTISICLMYQSFSKLYDRLFSCCDTYCYRCCIKLCFCCCSAKSLPHDIELAITQNTKIQSISPPDETSGNATTVTLQID